MNLTALNYNFIKNCIAYNVDKRNSNDNCKDVYYHVSVNNEPVAKAEFDREGEMTCVPNVLRFLIWLPLFAFICLVILPISFIFGNVLVEKVLGIGNPVTRFGYEIDILGTKLLALGCEFREGKYRF